MYYWIEPVNDWLVDSSPLGALVRVTIAGPIGGRGRVSLEDEFFLMVGLQLAGAVFFLLWAVWRLRPTFRRQEETPTRRGWFRDRGRRRRQRWLAHPECGDDPILWKERYFAPFDRFTRLILLPAIIIITLPLALMTEVEGRLSQVAMNFWRHGLDAYKFHPENFLWALQVDLGWYVAFWLLAVAGAAASSVTIEREKDTWVSLTSTPLTGREILRGKVLGAIWHQRGFAAVLIFLWALALITGAASPPGVLASIALVALFTRLVATVGVYASLRGSSTSRAIGSALTALVVLNGYPFYLYGFLRGRLLWDSSFSLLGLLPSLSAWSTVPGQTFDRLWKIIDRAGDIPQSSLLGPAVLLLYAAIAMALTRRIVGQFDRWLDRPPLSATSTAVSVPARDLEEVATRR